MIELEGAAYLAESAFAYAPEEDKVEEVDIAVKVDWLEGREDRGVSVRSRVAKAGIVLTSGLQQRAPIAERWRRGDGWTERW